MKILYIKSIRRILQQRNRYLQLFFFIEQSNLGDFCFITTRSVWSAKALFRFALNDKAKEGFRTPNASRGNGKFLKII